MRTAGDIATPVKSDVFFDVENVRKDFPALHQKVHGKPLIYLDNAATTQKPQIVIDTLRHYYSTYNSNVHRGVHYLSQKATEQYEESRKKVNHFINADSEHEIVFVRGATEGINLVANSYVRRLVKPGDEIIISEIEHHSNIVPWQIVCQETGARLRIIPVDDRGELIFEGYERLLGEKTKFVSLVHISNALGTVNPVKQMIKRARQAGVRVLIDGAQAISHMPVDVQDLGCDFYVMSGHKMFGPTGVGVLYGKAELLDSMPPYQGGGDMIKSVTFEKTIYNDIPYKFEAGTPNIAGVIGLGAAIDYMNEVNLSNVFMYEKDLLAYATELLSSIDGLRIIGTAKEKSAVISFVMEGIHPHDIGTIIDTEGIAIRTGHHCSQPVMQRYGVPATARASLALYNTKEEINALVDSIYKVKKVFQ